MGGSDVEYDPDNEEPPRLSFLRGYWQSQRGGRSMPRRQDISPSQMRAHLPHILLADVVRGGEDFRYRLVGGELQRYFRGNPTGKMMSEALAPFGEDTLRRTIQTYASAVARRGPLRISGPGEIYAQTAKRFDALLVPLSDGGDTVNMVLGTFLFVWGFQNAGTMAGLVEPDEAALANALYLGK